MILFQNSKIKLMKEKIELEKEKASMEGRYSLFETQFVSEMFNKLKKYDDYVYFYELIKENDEICNLPHNIGVLIDRIANDNMVFVHRTNLKIDPNKEIDGVPNNKDLYNIMRYGLKNYGHINAAGGSAFLDELPSITCTMTPLEGLAGYINLLSSYKDNDTVILASFPKDWIKSDGELLGKIGYSDIYDISNDVPTIKPLFMVGALVKGNNKYWDFYSRDQIINSVYKENDEKKL